jgi:hypothetical protein
VNLQVVQVGDEANKVPLESRLCSRSCGNCYILNVSLAALWKAAW